MLDPKSNIIPGTTRKPATRKTAKLQIDPSFCIDGLLDTDISGNYPWYAITINPETTGVSKMYDSGYNSQKRSLPDPYPNCIYDHIDQLFNKFAGYSDYFLFPEFSKSGRFHYHGIIRINSDALVLFFMVAMPQIVNLGAISIEHITDMGGWLTYCQKQRKAIEPFFKLPISGMKSRCYLLAPQDPARCITVDQLIKSNTPDQLDIKSNTLDQLSERVKPSDLPPKSLKEKFNEFKLEISDSEEEIKPSSPPYVSPANPFYKPIPPPAFSKPAEPDYSTSKAFDLFYTLVNPEDESTLPAKSKKSTKKPRKLSN